MRRVLLSLLLLLSIAGCGGGGGGGWHEVFRDDFTGTGKISSNWLHDLGTCYPGCPAPQWGTGEIETMTDALDNVALDGRGHLAITPQLRNGQWTSGRIETRRADFTIPPGGTLRVEARIALPAVNPRTGAGYWPAFWMLGSKLRDGYTGWPAVGEIDILEAVNGRPSVLAAMHCGVTPGGPCQEPQGLSSGEHPCPNCHGTFHTYAVEMTEARTTWFLDNKPYFSLNRSLPGAFFLILNVAIGGGFPTAFGGGPTEATLPGQPMLIDHVTVQTRPRP